jgi:ATP-dependent Clp protease adaptor protein ClpS
MLAFLMSLRPQWVGAEVAQDFGSATPGSAVRAAIQEPTIEQETKTEQNVDLPWLVVVHNDPINLMTYVTMVFQRVFGYPREKAEQHMLEVHQKGRSILWSGMRERAELYVQQLHGYLLLATLERTE